VELFHSHRRTRNAIWNATPSNAAQCEGSARCGLCSFGIFRTRTAILESRRLSDALRKDGFAFGFSKAVDDAAD
jgi:hypothetical protein